MQTEIRPCNGGFVTFGSHSTIWYNKNVSCNSPYQDARYGKGMRLHNPQQAKNLGHFRCTVCGQGHGPCRPNP